MKTVLVGRNSPHHLPLQTDPDARLVLINEGDAESYVFYDINYSLTPPHDDDVLYFHAYWQRERPTTLGDDFEILPRIAGKGRYLGTNVGVVTDSLYGRTWWGEGEVKIYLDEDATHPTLVGSGTEDYIGTGWGQGVFMHRYQGCTLADAEKRQWAFYRYHVPDPVFFQDGVRVTLQQIGGSQKEHVIEMLADGVRLQPISIDGGGRQHFVKLLERSPVPDLTDAGLPNGWTNFYREDDVSATVYFYLDRPTSTLPPLAPVEARTAGLE